MKELKNVEVGDKIYFGLDNFGVVKKISKDSDNIIITPMWQNGELIINIISRAVFNKKGKFVSSLDKIYTEKERNARIEMENKVDAQMEAWDKISKEFEEELSVYNGINMDFTNLKKLITEYEKIGKIEE